MNNEISQKINGLNYNPDEILSFQGEKVGSFIPNTGMFNGNTYIVTTKEKRSISDGSADISVIDAITDRTYPGALLLANRKLVENMPTSLQIKRAPLTLRVNLPGIEEEGTVTVDNPSYSAVSTEVNKILNEWLDKKSEKYHNTANSSYSETTVHTKDQLTVKLGCNVESLSKRLDIDFSSTSKGEKTTFVLEFKQIFYTISIDGPEQPAYLFADDVTWDMITSQGVNDMNPPVYIANVAYGRTIYVALETEKNNQSVEAKLNLAIRDNKLDSSVLKDSIFEGAKYSAVVIGGDAETHTAVVTKDFGEIAKIIIDGALFSAKNPGVPVSYTTVFLKHNEIATINRSAEYIKTTNTEYASGKIVLRHTGGYIAKFYINWEEFSFDKNGEKQVTKKFWEQNDQSLTAPFNTEISLPGNATNIHIKATEKTGLLWEPWRTVVNQSVSNSPTITVSIWGTTLNPQKSVELSQ